jgi:RNA polymerase sigma-70 factor (ECF subfamily)
MRQQLAALHEQAWRWSLACCNHDREQSMEVLHDVYVKLLEGRATFNGQSTFKTWLFGVIRMSARNHRRKARFAALFFLPLEDEANAAADPQPHADSGCRKAIENALAALSRRQSEITRLVFFHDLTIEEAATVQGISVGSARQHYARAKDRLRAILIDNGVTGL